MQKFYVISLIFLLLLSNPGFAVIFNDSINIYAVTTSGEGLVANLDLKIENGTGKIWSAVTPLVGTSTQQAERTAVHVAKNFFPGTNKYDFKYTISSDASVVEGPSAGAAMTLLTVAMLTNRDLPTNVSITGTINEDGSVGPVGGVFEKAKEASQTGVKLFLIPRGEAIQTVRLDGQVRSVNLLEYAPATWGLKVVEVETIDDALEFAFSNVEEIDVNTIAQEIVPDFVPEKIPIPEHLGSFKILTTNYLNETKQIVGEARNALAGTLLEDPDATSFLLSVLNDSEQTLSNAEILNEQNYLYSAANFGFLARVNAIVVKEIATNPDILRTDSTSLDLKVLELDKELNDFEKDLGGNIPKSGLEWFASAQQRFTYAKLTVQKLRTQEEIIVNGTEDDALRQRLEKIQDYAFAAAWLDVSKDFYSLSLESNGLVKPGDDFKPQADALISESETGLNSLELETPREDIQRRIDSAKIQSEKNWFEASFFDAASAKALVDAEKAVAEKSNEELRKLLEDKILEAENKIADSNANVGWPILFLDHAKYFLESAKYYDERELTVSSTNNLKSGMGLAFLASELFDATDSIVVAYSNKEIVQESTEVSRLPEKEDNFFLIGALLFFLAFSMVLLLLLLSYAGGNRQKQIMLETEIPRIRNLIRNSDEKFLRGEINSDEHSKLKQKYSNELNFLESQRRIRAEHVLAIDDYSSEIDSVNERLVALKKHFKEGILSKKEFADKSIDYLGKMENYKSRLGAELNFIEKQKELLKKINLDAMGSERILDKKSSVEKKSPAKKPSPQGKQIGPKWKTNPKNKKNN
ncbi:MAG TPA: S16 family serine protease [archaeon]|nr:S16 family serine protease [archaeon]